MDKNSKKLRSTDFFINRLVKNIVAQQGFEGILLSNETIKDLNARASGKMTSEQVMSNIKKRTQKIK